jgi:hypothetical protein
VALWPDAKSKLDRSDLRFTLTAVQIATKQRVRETRDDVTQRCLSWLKAKMPGTLSALREGLGPPTCALLTLVKGKPFETDAPYMDLLDLKLAIGAQKFVNHDFLFLTHPIGSTFLTPLISMARENELLAAFNETDAQSSGWLSYPSAAPEVFHWAIASLMIADALDAVLLSFERHLRDVRADLGRLDLVRAAGAQVVELRNRLLGISREISIVCTDLSVLLADAAMIWNALSPLTWLQSSGNTSAAANTTADTKKRQLRTTMDSLQTQESGLRDLILVTSQSMSETRNLDLQAKVLDLTNKLGGLTKWLIVLTVLLVLLGVAALWVQVAHSPTVTVRVTQTSQPASPTAAPTPRPSLSPHG